MVIHYRKDTKKFIVRVRNKKLNIDYTKSFSSITLAKKHKIKICHKDIILIKVFAFIKININE